MDDVNEGDEIVRSERAGKPSDAIGLSDMLKEMGKTYRADPIKAVRGQSFIKLLHNYIGSQLEYRLTKFAVKRGTKVQYESNVLGSTKPKDVDVAVVDPENGPLVLVGVRSQMSSISKNVLTYYEGIVGECISLQERFLHPLTSIKEGKEAEYIDHKRCARFYAAVTNRSGPNYKNLRGIFDQFAYMIVDFENTPPSLHDELVRGAVEGLDLSINTFVDRIINTFNSRNLFWDVFK